MQTHRWILGGALIALACGAAQAQCATVLVERFIPADCEACWREGKALSAGSFVLDWIVPSARGDEAPLSAAALTEASARSGAIQPDATLERRHTLAASVLRVQVEDGPAWNGYMGLRLAVRHDGAALPEGATGWLALVENLAAAEEGSPIARRVVRVLAGPLALDPARPTVDHLLALRLPQGARASRLGAVGWVEDAVGRVVALAQAGASNCAPQK